MAPFVSHDKFGQRLAGSRSELAIAQWLGQGVGIAQIADGHGGNRLPVRGDSEDFAGFFDMIAAHLMNE